MDDNDLQHDLRRYIEAFADGELDVETNLRILERMAMNPKATQRVMHQQQLRRLVDQAMREQTPQVPAGLRSRIMAISAAAALDESGRRAARAASPSSFLLRLRAWLPAAAAVLVVALGFYLWSINRSGTGERQEPKVVINPVTPVTPSIPVTPDKPDPSKATLRLADLDRPVYREDLMETGRVSRMGTRHESCSSKIDNLYRADDFSTVLTEVPAKIAKYLGPQINVSLPDLTELGYKYRGAGACSLPGGKAVHLVYRPIDSAIRSDSLSLWIRSDEAKEVGIEEGKLHTVTPEGSVHPVFVWRRGSAVYYLVGERSSLMKEAAGTFYAGR